MKLKGVCIGSGYFSAFHYDAWNRIPEVAITALASLDEAAGAAFATRYGMKYYSDYREMLVAERPDFVDIITPPATHAEMAGAAADLGIQVICQKPITPDVDESIRLMEEVSEKVRFLVHENFRFQPWHREIARWIHDGRVGDIQNLAFRSRMGDGWGDDAYLERQPYFRAYERFLIYETGIHFIDLFRYHSGQNPESVFARLKRLNPVIRGEDCGLMVLDFGGNATAIWDADRFHEHNYSKNRYTFGEYLVEGSKGSLRLYGDGSLTWQALGAQEKPVLYEHHDRGFAGDSCLSFQRHAVNALLSGEDCETEGSLYAANLVIQEAVYRSARTGEVVWQEW